MLNWLIGKRIDAFGRHYGYDTSYMHHLLKISPRGFMRFSKIMEISRHCEDTPPEAYYAAKLAASVGEDCGPCTQLVTQMGEEAGVRPEILSAILRGDLAAMGEHASLAYRFAKAVLAHSLEADALREQIERRWGVRAVATLALAITSTRLYPTLKYALGYGHTCTRVRVGGADVVPQRALLAA